MAALGSPLHLHFSGREAKNRFCKAATTERMSTWDPSDRSKCGLITDEVIRLHQRWGEGEIGIIVTGAITIDPAYLEAPGNVIIDLDAPVEDGRSARFKEFARATKANGSLLLGQLNHTGRQTMAVLNPDPVSASDVRLEENEMGLEYNKPHAASLDEIAEMKTSFAKGASYLETAGFDGIQLNAAHGYLLSQFLSPTTNHRSDEYGGSLENRARFLLEVVREIRAACASSLVLSVKLNCVEYQPEGTTLDEVKTLCSWLEKEKVDILELSGGTYQEFGWKHKAGYTDEKREGYFLQAADTIRPVLTNTRLYATGGFFTAAAMTQALKVVDGIGIARGFCQEPDLARKILTGDSDGRSAQQLDQANYKLTCLLAGTQMRQMSQGKTPLDGGSQDVANDFMQKIGLWITDVTKNNPNGTKYGWMDVEAY